VRAAEVARHYGIAERVLRRWKQEFATAPAFVSVQITEERAHLHCARTRSVRALKLCEESEMAEEIRRRRPLSLP
jgi:hypothetical protein